MVVIGAVVVEEGDDGFEGRVAQFHVDGCRGKGRACEPGFIGDLDVRVGDDCFLAG